MFGNLYRKYLIIFSINPKMTKGKGGVGHQLDALCGFSKNVHSKERVKLWFFVTFKIIFKHIHFS